jgi:voltage-gated potassium channel
MFAMLYPMANTHRTLGGGPIGKRRVPRSHILMPKRRPAAIEQIGRRLVIALGLLTLMAIVVLIQRDGYTDSVDGSVGAIDAFYYAAVSATTTGFGDIAPASESARLFDLLIVTPARVMFLIVLVGTTMEILTDQSRHAIATRRWRKRVDDHHIICGYGSTGRSAVRALRAQGIDRDRIVVIERSAEGAGRASEDGYTTIEGDAARTATLGEAHIERARSVIVAPSRDDTAVLITLTARELNPAVTIVSGVRDAENLHLLTQSGADSVIHSAEAVGRLLGMATQSTAVASVMDDLLMPGSGFDVYECDPVTSADGSLAPPASSKVLAVVRDGGHSRLGGPIREGDRLVVLGPERGGSAVS